MAVDSQSTWVKMLLKPNLFFHIQSSYSQNFLLFSVVTCDQIWMLRNKQNHDLDSINTLQISRDVKNTLLLILCLAFLCSSAFFFLLRIDSLFLAMHNCSALNIRPKYLNQLSLIHSSIGATFILTFSFLLHLFYGYATQHS